MSQDLGSLPPPRDIPVSRQGRFISGGATVPEPLLGMEEAVEMDSASGGVMMTPGGSMRVGRAQFARSAAQEVTDTLLRSVALQMHDVTSATAPATPDIDVATAPGPGPGFSGSVAAVAPEPDPLLHTASRYRGSSVRAMSNHGRRAGRHGRTHATPSGWRTSALAQSLANTHRPTSSGCPPIPGSLAGSTLSSLHPPGLSQSLSQSLSQLHSGSQFAAGASQLQQFTDEDDDASVYSNASDDVLAALEAAEALLLK